MKTAYEILNLTWNASPEEIQAAYHEKVLTHHPDRGGNLENFLIVHRAFTLLKNYRLRNLFGLTANFPNLKRTRIDLPLSARYSSRGHIIS